MKTLLLLPFTCFFLFNAVAQDYNAAQANERRIEMEKVAVDALKQYIDALNKLYINNKEHSIEPVMKYLDPSFTSTTYTVDVGGMVKKTTGTLENMRSELSNYIGVDGFAINHILDRVDLVRIYDDFAIISFTLSRNATINNDPILKTKDFQTFYFKKTDQGWKAVGASMANIYKEQNMGFCPCQFTRLKQDESQYSAKVLVPNGTFYNTADINFEFISHGDNKIIKAGNNVYTWQNNKVTCTQEGTTPVTTYLSNASTSYEAMESIITKHLYSSCVGLKSLEKK